MMHDVYLRTQSGRNRGTLGTLCLGTLYSSKVGLIVLIIEKIKETRPDTRPPVADGWAGADVRVFPFFVQQPQRGQ